MSEFFPYFIYQVLGFNKGRAEKKYGQKEKFPYVFVLSVVCIT